MTARMIWVNVLLAVGTLGLVIGTIDPLEGSVLIVAGLILNTLAAWIASSRQRGLFTWALGVAVLSVGALFGVSFLGGVGGDTGRSLWWLLPIVVPYVLGWGLGVIATVRLYRELAEGARPSGRSRWVWPLLVLGTAGLVLGVLGPRLGPWGVALAALAAFLYRSRHRRVLAWALGLSVVGTLLVLIIFWWAVSQGRAPGPGMEPVFWRIAPAAIPYYLGWVLGIIGAVGLYRELLGARRAPSEQAGQTV
ncbi:hypothetical protein [Corynebacterium guangdongense]|uniref:Uncharacterized protein n=1 Tax=Corynebacterium guangdongense TaxID=1783348 RepID=A0ABU1ZUI1_9CORY|nr:hypothetical protein [Corynebacterium guangdongense]MDR7328591.1 hypothetical protein [Corynebacterium guangdongense]WJZ17168.1 hypothetical protein CGUA_02860 [Corynebacterium guangdongense]